MSPIVPPVNDVPFAPQPIAPGRPGRFFRKLLFPSSSTSPSPAPPDSGDERPRPPAGDHPFSSSSSASPSKTGLIRRMSRRVVPSLSRQQTFKRQQSERREYLAPVEQTPDERRAASVDRRSQRTSGRSSSHAYHSVVRSSAPSLMSGDARPETASAPTLVNARHMFTIEDVSREYIASPAPGDVLSPERDLDPCSSYEDQAQAQGRIQGRNQVQNQAQKVQAQAQVAAAAAEEEDADDEEVFADAPQAMTDSEYEEMIHEELERTWILNLSMHFRDRSKREKFFVTYRQQEHLWRRVTVSLDYREAPLYSLEHELLTTKSQKDKSARIYDAIRESLPDIQFYDTVTNLKLETTDGRLHVHVVEDGNEIIHFPTVNQIRYLGCKRIKERDIEFVSHMSGFVYKVQVHGLELIKKEIPSPDTIDEFLYEVNALNTLRFSDNVIQFHGVVVDDNDEFVKGLLISYAEQGALIDIIYERCKEKGDGIPWAEREKWARQIVQGLSDIHESGFVQGDFTLSNIVIDEEGDAKIIDINRRGCPIGWEPPEAADLIDSNQRLSMYIGVKSDLYQLGMVLWALAMMEDEPEAHNRHPLVLAPDVDVPDWFRQMTEICLSSNPRLRLQASSLLHLFPRASPDYGIIDGPDEDGRMDALREMSESLSDGDGSPTLNDYVVDRYQPHPNPAKRPSGSSNLWSQSNTTYADHDLMAYDDPYFEEERRGRSPPSPLPLSFEGCGGTERNGYFGSAWAANRHIPSSYSDSGEEDDGGVEGDEEPEEEEEEEEEGVLEEEEEEEEEDQRDREEERYGTYIPDEDFEDEHEDNGRLPLPLEIEDDSFRDPTPTPAADKMPARPASSGWLTGFGARAASDSSAQSPEAYAIEDPMFESLASPHLELPDMMCLEDLEDLYDPEAERASVRMSTYTARSDAPSERFGEAIEVKIVNLESSKNLNIIRTEGASRTRSPAKHPLEQAHPHTHTHTHTHEHAHAHALRSPSPQRPRVVEVVSIERRQSEDSIVHVSPGSRDAATREHESETEPEYTTSPDHRERRARDSRTASAVDLSQPAASTKPMTTTTPTTKDTEGGHLSAPLGRFDLDGEYQDERGAEDEYEGFRTARSSALMVSTESKTR